MELHLQKNGVLLGSTNADDYSKVGFWKAFVMAKEQSNIAITGNGAIDGQGRALSLRLDSLFYVGEIDSVNYSLPHRRPKPRTRPQLIELSSCKNITVKNVLLKNAACWVQMYDNCLLYTSPSPRDATLSRMPSSA